MDTFVFIVLMVFLPVLLILGLLVMLTVNVAVVGGFVCTIEWIGNMFKRIKSLKHHSTEVGKDTLQLESDDIFRRHEEAYIASIKNTDKGNNK